MRFRLVSLLLKPFDQVERIERIAFFQRAGAPRNFAGLKRLLQERRHACDNDRRRRFCGDAPLRETDQRLQPFAHDVDVRQARFVRQNFPCGKEQRPSAGSHPCFDVLLKNHLGLKAFRHHDNRPSGKEPGQQGGEKRLGRLAYGLERQRYPLFQAFAQGLHDGNGSDDRHNIAGRQH